MRILVLAPHPFFQQRGTPIAVRALAEVLAEAGHELDLVAYHEGEDVEIPGVTIHRIVAPPGIRGVRPGFSGKKLVCDAFLLARAWGLLRTGRYDLVHAVEEAVFLAVAFRAVLGVPYVYDMDSSLAHQMMERFARLRPIAGLLEGFERAAVKRSAGVIAVCKALEERVVAWDPGKALVRLEDVSLLEGSPDGAARTPPLGGGIAPPVLMYVGNLERYQGIDLLLEGFATLVRGGVGASLVIVGGAREDIERYGGRAADLGVADRVHFLGPRPVSLLGAHLAQADVLVSPRTLGFNTPMKIYSYLDAGRPVVATRLPTHTQVLDDEVACLVDPDPAGLALGLRTVLEDPVYAGRIAAAGRERARRDFTPEAFARKLLAFYREVEGRLAAGEGRTEP